MPLVKVEIFTGKSKEYKKKFTLYNKKDYMNIALRD